jgi:hypothetical protein
MDVIFRNMTFHDLNIFAPANLPKDISDSKGEFPLKNWFPILRNPHQMEMNLKNRMGTVPVCAAHVPAIHEEC